MKMKIHKKKHKDEEPCNYLFVCIAAVHRSQATLYYTKKIQCISYTTEPLSFFATCLQQSRCC